MLPLLKISKNAIFSLKIHKNQEKHVPFCLKCAFFCFLWKLPLFSILVHSPLFSPLFHSRVKTVVYVTLVIVFTDFH